MGYDIVSQGGVDTKARRTRMKNQRTPKKKRKIICEGIKILNIGNWEENAPEKMRQKNKMIRVSNSALGLRTGSFTIVLHHSR